MKEPLSFKDYAIVSCGTLAPELNYLRKEGFLDAKEIVYTTPGRHEVLKELESQLIQRINTVKQHCQKIIIVYGGKFCYVNLDNPYRTIDTIIAEQEVKLIIAGGMGQRAQQLFAQNDIKVFFGAPQLDPDDLVRQYLQGELVCGENICDH